MKRIVAVLVLLALFASASAQARLLRRHAIDEQVEEASFIGIVVAGEQVEREVEGVSMRFATFQVESTIKGSTTAALLTTRGSIDETNPVCCVEGARYLVLVEPGVAVILEDADRELIFESRLEDEAVSSVNGQFGVLRIVDGRVEGWLRPDVVGKDDLASVTATIARIATGPPRLGLVPIGGVPTTLDIFDTTDCDELGYADCSGVDYAGRRYAFFGGALSRVSATAADTNGQRLPFDLRFGEPIEAAAAKAGDGYAIALDRGVSPGEAIVYSSDFIVESMPGVVHSVELVADSAGRLAEVIERTDF